jgi:hypothetical protein
MTKPPGYISPIEAHRAAKLELSANRRASETDTSRIREEALAKETALKQQIIDTLKALAEQGFPGAVPIEIGKKVGYLRQVLLGNHLATFGNYKLRILEVTQGYILRNAATRMVWHSTPGRAEGPPDHHSEEVSDAILLIDGRLINSCAQNLELSDRGCVTTYQPSIPIAEFGEGAKPLAIIAGQLSDLAERQQG